MTETLTLAHGLTNAALNGEDLLRLLAARAHGVPFASQTEIAKAAGRAPKNIGRDLAQLETAGLVRAPGHDHGEWSSAAVTDAGWSALEALDRAAGRGGSDLLFVAPAMLDDNPLNPRKVYDPEALEAFADTVEADGQIITPLSVSPVQPNGRRFIWAGHRRKRGALIVEARFAARGEALPPGLAAGVPCVERDASPTEALFIAVVENGQRENLTPWEDAQALAALAEATGWSGRELARKTGLAPGLDQGDERGVRDVQEKIKVAKTAPADLVEAHETGALTWEQFRGALRTGNLPTSGEAMFPAEAGQLREETPHDVAPPSEPEPPALVLNAAQRLVLLEIAHAARFHPDRLVVGEGADQVAYAPTGKYWLDLTASTLQTLRLVDFKHHGRPYIRVSPTGLAWMVDHIGDGKIVTDDDCETALAAARMEAEPDTPWIGPGYLTDWLNPPPPTPAQAAPQQTQAEAETVDVEDAVAAQLLADAEAFVADGAMRQATWLDLLTRTGTDGPFTTDRAQMGCVIDAQGETVCVVDVDNVLLDDLAQARAVLIAAALNRACGLQPSEAE